MSFRHPQPRLKHAAVAVGMQQFVWGGDGGFGHPTIQTKQIETFDMSSVKWEEPRFLKDSLPDELCGMAVTTDGVNIYSFGGGTNSGFINTVYEINPSTLQCRELRPASLSHHVPKGATGSGIVYFKEKLLLYGGFTNEMLTTDDLHVFDLKTSEYGNSKLYPCIVCACHEGNVAVRGNYAYYSSVWCANCLTEDMLCWW